MRIEKTLSRYNKLASILRDTYDAARQFGTSHARLLRDVQRRVHEHPHYASLPKWAKNQLSQDSLRALEALYHPQLHRGINLDAGLTSEDAAKLAYLRWFHVRKDGTLTDTWDRDCEPDSGAYRWNHKRHNVF